MQSNSWGNTQQRWVSSGFPFTIFVMASMFASALLLTVRPDIYRGLMFVAPQTVAHPWTFLTYPLLSSAQPSIFTLLFDIGLTYFFCSSLERSWGTKAFALFFVSISVVSGLSLWAGTVLLGGALPADNLFPVAGAAVVWGVAQFRRADEPVFCSATRHLLRRHRGAIHPVQLCSRRRLGRRAVCSCWLSGRVRLAQIWNHLPHSKLEQRSDSNGAPDGAP